MKEILILFCSKGRVKKRQKGIHETRSALGYKGTPGEMPRRTVERGETVLKEMIKILGDTARDDRANGEEIGVGRREPRTKDDDWREIIEGKTPKKNKKGVNPDVSNDKVKDSMRDEKREKSATNRHVKNATNRHVKNATNRHVKNGAGRHIKNAKDDRLSFSPTPKVIEGVDKTEVVCSSSERLSKRLSACGVCSRREAEAFIRSGRVSVDGVVTTSVATVVNPSQAVFVDNKKICAPRPEMFIFYKPRKVLITHLEKEDQQRRTLGQILSEIGKPNLRSVGRLDYLSEGLILLTNDGELKKYLEHPNSEFVREYRVRVHGHILIQRLMDICQKSFCIGGIHYRPIQLTFEQSKYGGAMSTDILGNSWIRDPIKFIHTPGKSASWSISNFLSFNSSLQVNERMIWFTKNTWIRVRTSEGKRHEVRIILAHLGLNVSRLIRVRYAAYTLKDLRVGDIKRVEISPLLKYKPK
ncbi:ribosomal large subunit pseudouridine synthase B-like isoform X3 [Schistocerca gregaria]|uniref:ribosomal large subunit pseudouridine synthase B-like isoform X3 n=1 Tax=Schistocerca gregaria TaxID=7010 RepID=UPI00211DE772|nr:ribosomal large subunit pseudouridine synthase B-like isoform X3 [Schistocerca gregaria]